MRGHLFPARRSVPFAPPIRLLLPLLLLTAAPAASQVRLPAGSGVAELEADQQRLEGKVYFADGNVVIRYENLLLRADHVEYHTETSEAAARGRVVLEIDSQHLAADEARYNLRTGRGRLRRVRGTVYIQRRERDDLLVSDNPFYFEAEEVERTGPRTYDIRDAWITVCDPQQPKWTFHAPRATLRVEGSVRLAHANFRLFHVPILYLPYATAPVGRQMRQSGFLVPHVANTSRKGFVFGDSFYWAMLPWADLTLGGEFLSRRGFSHMGELRVRPWENVRIRGTYFAVEDRGLPGPDGVRVPQGGHQTHVELDARLPGGWRAMADLNTLTSLRFRLAFAETFAQAVRSEVRSTAWVANDFRGFTLGFSASGHKNFLSAEPETAVKLRVAPGVRFSAIEQAPWRSWPVYFGFHAAAEAVHRSDPQLETAAAVQRTEFAPRVTIPLRWGPWLGVTTTAQFRTTRYGSQLLSGTVVGDSLRRNTGEISVDLRPPALARIWGSEQTRWKHTVEPQVLYRYADGVNRFGRFLRFDEADTLTDTNEVEYAVTQRFYRRTTGGETQELVSWRVAQKYYFDPTFGGAIVPGERNVFQALASVTPFAFADGARRFSPIVSDLRITPGGRYDAQFRFDYDTERQKMTALGTLVKIRPYREAFVTLAHFATRADPALQPLSNQVRALVGYGEMHRKGWNAALGFSYDVNQQFLQNQVVQVSYNGSCCGIGFEFRRLALGPVRSENQFRVSLLIANLATFGNLRRQEKIF